MFSARAASWLGVGLLAFVTAVSVAAPATPRPLDANRYAYLDEPCDPYYVNRNFPKLITPQWVGEEGVDAIVVLAIDDMRETAKYEKWLRPVLNRLKQIDGRAPVSIMTCRADPKDPQLAAWLKEGLSIECHTFDHPCPLLRIVPAIAPATAPATKPAALPPAAECCDTPAPPSPPAKHDEAPATRPTQIQNHEPIRLPMYGDSNRVWVWGPGWRPENSPTPERAAAQDSVRIFERAASGEAPAPGTFAAPPALAGSKANIDAAALTYDTCVEVMFGIPGNKPVAFRTPCCDSRNTVSPRLFTQIICQPTAKKHFLTIDSSVFNILTPNDPELPRELVQNADGTERFRRYLPFKNFVNTIEDYPYPYLINNLIWEFPCVVPSDWEAQNIQRPFNPRTLEDWKANLDAIVIKKGVFTAVFHPHGWIKPEQVTEFVDYTHKKYGKRVKFLNFRECQERLDKNLLLGQPVRNPKTGEDNGIRLLDVNNDGYLDVLIGNSAVQQTRLYSPALEDWLDLALPCPFVTGSGRRCGIVGAVGDQAEAGIIWGRRDDGSRHQAWIFADGWRRDGGFFSGLRGDLSVHDWRFLDIDGDGISELIHGRDNPWQVFRREDRNGRWTYAPDASGSPFRFLDGASIRFIDLNGDGKLDLFCSSENREAAYLFHSFATGWSTKLFDRDSATSDAQRVFPPMLDVFDRDNGFFVHSGQLCWVNEETSKLPDLIFKRALLDVVGNVEDIPAGKSAEASFKALKPRPGFQAQLVAKEPLVQDPIAFAFGADGKLWVVEMGDYPLGVDGKGKPGGKVKILEDTDGDGVFDKATVFLDGLNFPTGVTPWKKGVLITAAPDIIYAEDANGDGKADKREVLFTGFSEGNQQHRINGLVMGLDNWFYGANGHSNGVVKSTKTGKSVDIRNRDFRIRPETGEIEVVSGPTQYGRARDDWDNWFGNDNSHPFYQFPLEDHYLRRNPYVTAPAGRLEVPDIPGPSPVYPISRTLTRFNDFSMANHFTSANSAIIYRDDLFGPAFSNSFFVSEPVHNLVSRQVLRTDGLRYRSSRAADEQQSEFLASSDNWFRPTMLRVGPDGALWVADMYRLVIEHPQWIPKEWQEKLDLRAGHDMGRIYRVWPVGVEPRKMPRLEKMNVEQLAAAIDSPSGWQRDMAQQLLVERQDATVIPDLEKLAREAKRPQTRVQALCTLSGLTMLPMKEEVLTAALKDAHPGVRRHAVRLSESLLNSGHSDLGPAIAAMVDDADPHVRQQVAYTLGEWENPKAGAALATILMTSADEPLIQTAALSSLRPANMAATLSAIGKATGAATPSPTLISGLARMVAAAQDLPATAALLDSITRKPADGDFQTWQFRAAASFYDALEGKDGYIGRPSTNEPLGRAMTQAVAMTSVARVIAADVNQKLDRRLASLSLLGRFRDQQAEDQKLFLSLLIPEVPTELQAAAVSGIARSRSADVPATLIGNWKRYTPGLRGEVLDALLTRPAWATALLDAVEKGQVKPVDIDPARRQAMLKSKIAAIHDRAEKLFAAAINPDRQKVIDALRPKVLDAKGDAKRGSEVFTRTCATCHAVAGVGNAVGPDLASVGDKSPDGLLVAILDPNRAVEPRFVSYVIETKAGDTLSGLLANESGNAVTLLSPDGKTQQILRSDIRELRSTGLSLMPEGLESGMQPQDMADLIAFVQTTRPQGNKRTFEGNQPALVVPQPTGALRLTPATAEISGKTIVLEKKYGNLGYWQSQEDEATWSAQPARGGAYEVWLTYACPKEERGKELVVQVGSGEKPQTRFSWIVGSTANWDTYSRVRIGMVNLEAGRQRITIRPAGPIKGALLDLKEVELIPSK